MTVDFGTWSAATVALLQARQDGTDAIEVLDRRGLLLSQRKRNDLHCDFIDRMLILLRSEITPWQLQHLNGTESNITAAGTHAGFITWLEKMREDFE